ncbi:hypothetical protein BpHYR1_011364, partial [Brachionus plicatilis]
YKKHRKYKNLRNSLVKFLCCSSILLTRVEKLNKQRKDDNYSRSGKSFICIYGFISNPSNHFIPQYYSKIDTDPKTYVSPVSTQTINTNRQKPTNRNPLRELNLQTNQTKSQISKASNI